MHVAIATSLVAVTATACTAAAAYVRARFTNIRLGLLLETTTVVGALAGAFLATWLEARCLAALFGLALVYAGYSMFRRRNHAEGQAPAQGNPGHGSAGRWAASLSASYRDPVAGGEVGYSVGRIDLGLAASTLAGVLSGLLGIGGGVIKVPVMNLVMGVPMRAAIGTSNFMIGITAAASAFVYYSRGYVDPMVAAPVLLGVFLGTRLGVGMMQRTRGGTLRVAFAVILFLVAASMWLRAAGVGV
ncbi:MAG: sulfite exporter TauE/SafE family protein, partial [Chloroflexota bacterium]